MIDNFAIPAATIRGLFDYDYRADRLILRPRVPGSITEYVQKEPVRFGEKTLYLSCRNGGLKVKSVAVNGKALSIAVAGRGSLAVRRIAAAGENRDRHRGRLGLRIVDADRALFTPAQATTKVAAAPQSELPESLKKPYAAMKALDKLLAQEANAAFERTFVREAIGAIDAWRERTTIEAQGFFRPMTTQKRDAIVKFYENAALRMYQGFAKRMSGYAKSSDTDKQRLAELFRQVAQ